MYGTVVKKFFCQAINELMYTHICVQTVYELPLLPNKTASETLLHKSGACAMMIGSISLGPVFLSFFFFGIQDRGGERDSRGR